jgi:hypothetical protein
MAAQLFEPRPSRVTMTLAESVQNLRPFLPAENFGISREFYKALGFKEVWTSEKLSIFEIGQFSFFLQDYFVKEWAENTMMDLRVADVDACWSYLQSLNLVERFPGVVSLKEPRDDGAGIRRGHFVDPSGILSHFSQPAASK